MKKKRIAIFISGTGSNMDSLITASRSPDFPAEVALVLTNKADSPGLKRVVTERFARVIVSHNNYHNRATFDAALQTQLEDHDIEIVCLAGFLRILTAEFVNRWRGKMINIHPSLLPSYKGLHTHKRAIQDGVKFTGCTVHFVVPELDAGPIIIQAAVPIYPADTEDTLGARVLSHEHMIYPRALKWLASDQLHIEGNRVKLIGNANQGQSVYNPI